MSIGTRQLEPGNYIVEQSGNDIGEVYAEGTAGATVVEHWVLLDAFESPTTTSSMDVIKATSGYSNLTAFFAAMQTRIDNDGKDGQYIKATCVYDPFKQS
jgi:hypothetical protein